MNIGDIKKRIKEIPVLYKLLLPVVLMCRYIIFKTRKFTFQISKYSSRLKKVKSTAKRERCFVIGNGPSLTIDNLEKLYSNKEICFASNGICGVFDKTEWKPDVYALIDGTAFKVVQNYLSDIEKHVKYVFLSVNDIKQNSIYMKIIDNSNIYPFFHNQFGGKADKKKISFSHDISKYIGDGYTVTCTLIQIAMYMGYKEIYLLGVDHTLNYKPDSNGNVDLSTYHFKGAKNIEKPIKITQYSQDVFKYSTDGYELCKKESQKCGVKIYNATRGGKLEVFERVNFDDLFEK